ncbi:MULTISPECIES: helix-turn-helix transcriptional regulator [unclassified Streptomyces]|uniref:helix-turn-helix transcriptional regulator n=1 Tax=unclassified Streptomyces TaxID=2593676 RepID=UPI0033E858A8
MTSQRRSSSELGSFLRALRARVTPAKVGLTVGAGLRRTPGLRREEVATLAGVSIDYYARLERGTECHPSPSVIDALAHALQLNADEHGHLRELVACAARATPGPAPEEGSAAVSTRTVGPEITLLLENLRPHPAYVINSTLDVIASNPAGLRLFSGLEEWPAERRNIARYVFLHPAARDLLADWSAEIHACAGCLRALAVTSPDTPGLAPLVDELLVTSTDFARLWEDYDVRAYSHGNKTFQHPDSGALTLVFQSSQLEGTPGDRLITYFAPPDSPEHDAVTILDKDTRDERAGVRRSVL